jgi:BlaI family penicillinase repressor
MPESPTISDAEWEVMHVLWISSAPMMAGEIVEQLAATKTWSPKTVKTLLNRLINKGALSFETRGKSYLYRPALRREQCVRAATQSFLSRVFAGSVGPMLIHFVTHTDLSPAEMEELQRLLRDKQTGAKRHRKR